MGNWWSIAAVVQLTYPAFPEPRDRSTVPSGFGRQEDLVVPGSTTFVATAYSLRSRDDPHKRVYPILLVGYAGRSERLEVTPVAKLKDSIWPGFGNSYPLPWDTTAFSPDLGELVPYSRSLLRHKVRRRGEMARASPPRGRGFWKMANSPIEDSGRLFTLSTLQCKCEPGGYSLLTNCLTQFSGGTQGRTYPRGHGTLAQFLTSPKLDAG
ncbi:hypothetical protein R1flu_004229 [Riccia fluitans]|uniref:Uncharacterized protein n=1 Tax=Riccia fluitans TaxID=41844 RepID=A0ABD1YPP9_9MARC